MLFLIHNQQYLKQLIAPYTIQRDELIKLHDPIFSMDICKQYDNVVKWMLVKELTQHTQASVEDTLIFLESFNLEEYMQ